MPRYYKVLNADGSTQYGGSFKYDLPKWKGPKSNGRWIPGAWTRPVENPVLCERGYHGCARDRLVDFLSYGPVIAVMEVRGTVIQGEDKMVASEARLTELLPWDECAARLFAVECAADVLDNYERAFPNDSRVSDALVVSHLFALGMASESERSAAWSAADSAADSAAWSAYSAAYSAAWSAARSAAWSAYSAARSAAWSAADSAARKKQTNRLMFWLGEE